MYNNSVSLIGYYGNDETHAIPVWGEEKVIEKKENIYKLLKILANKDKINSFKLSNFHFNLDIDYVSYKFLRESTLGFINLRESTEENYIPRELCEFKLGMDVYNKEQTFFPKGTYYFDVLLDYIELGNKIKTQLKTDLHERIPPERIIENINLINSFSQKINFDISLNFYELVKLIQFINDVNCSIELKEIFQTMFDLVVNIPNNPFKRSFKAFGLIEEPRNFNNKGERVIR